MHSFRYVQGRLNCESVDLEALAEKHGTPLYVYSKETISDHFKRLDQGMERLDHLVCYAVKANSNIAILQTIAELGGGFDIVSGGELFRVLKAGGQAGKCTFAGVGKTRGEIEFALQQGIYSFNAESEAELRLIDQVAGELGKKAPVDFDRVLDAYAAIAKDCPNLEIRGLQMHIGSQLTSIDPFVEAAKKVTPLVEALKERHNIQFFSIGGGIGIVYRESLDSGDQSWWGGKSDEERPLTINTYANALVPILEPLKLRILMEPGRFMVGNAGALLTKVLYLKQGNAKKFVIVDVGMNDLIRPALYEGWHQITPLKAAADSTVEKVDVVGPICETGDFIAQDREIPPVVAGETLAVLSAGAYGFTMASNYNSRPLAAEILVDGKEAHLIRERQTLDDLIKGEHLVGSTE